MPENRDDLLQRLDDLRRRGVQLRDEYERVLRQFILVQEQLRILREMNDHTP